MDDTKVSSILDLVAQYAAIRMVMCYDLWFFRWVSWCELLKVDAKLVEHGVYMDTVYPLLVRSFCKWYLNKHMR